MNLTEKTISNELKYKGNFLELYKSKVELPNYKKSTREFIVHPGASCVLALDDNYVIMVKQYRYPISKITYEIPAGKLNYSENPINCAYREFEEETGYKALNLKLLAVEHPASAYTTEKIYIYFTNKISKGTLNLDSDEFLECERIHINKVLEMVMKNEITDSKTQIAVMKYILQRNNNNEIL